MRTCIKCHQKKEDSAFSKKGGRRGGEYLSSLCKPCKSIVSTEHRRQARLKALEYAGGKCIRCGYDKCIQALEFHHRDPSQKEFQPNRIYSLTDKLKREIAKCDLLCSNCHREEHFRSVADEDAADSKPE